MIAFDTNLVVRAVVNDDPAQVALVRSLMLTNTVFLSQTVLLETEWVLRSRYQQPRSVITDLVADLLAADDVVLENADQVIQALEWYRLGADFADALHLAACGRTLMHTFDRNFCRQAQVAGVAPKARVLEADKKR